jgi:hypothetical protein
VADKDRPESPLTLVDQYSGFDPSTMIYDGTHPNAVGDARMADRWFEKLTPVLDALLTEAEKVGFEPTVRVAQKGPMPGGFPVLCLSFGSAYSPHPEVF